MDNPRNSLSAGRQSANRTVRKIKPCDDSPFGTSLKTFSQYLEVPNIILLGDPGSGKTYTFIAAAEEEKAYYLNVRQFLSSGGTTSEEGTVYLDGLDEFRSRIGDKNAIIEVIKVLGQMRRPRLRLSCRAADWLGESDLSLFLRYFGSSPYVVLNLEALTKTEIKSILDQKGIRDADAFIREAQNKGIEGLLSNPQTLIMLSDVILRKGNWPDTKCELFEKAIQILLAEHNRDHIGPGVGQFCAEELIEPAGAACAALLISGVDGISLLESNTSDDFPSYRSIPDDDLLKAQACLARRAFSFTDAGQEAVSYIHRTIAEFLAAKWLVKRISNGLPLQRVQNIVGIEGHPASELRGLHAWLATLLPLDVTSLIRNDPYGILMYGDPRTLSLSNRRYLLDSLASLSQGDPWFRSGDFSDKPLGALSGPDMVASFRRILADPTATFHLRSVVMDAIRNGPPQPQMCEDLKSILSDPSASYRDRVCAADALLNVTSNGAREIVEIFKSQLAPDPSTVRLRIHILTQMYGEEFNPSDVASVFTDTLADTTERVSGDLLVLAYSLPETALQDVIEHLCDALGQTDRDRQYAHASEVIFAFSRLISRALSPVESIPTHQLWRWLKALHGFRGSASGDKDDLRKWLLEHKSIVLDMFRIACDELDIEKEKWIFLYDFRQAVMYSVSSEELAHSIFSIFRSKEMLTAKDHFLYQVWGSLIFESDPIPRDLLDAFYDFPRLDKGLETYRDELCCCKIEEWRWETALGKNSRQNREADRRSKNRSELEKEKEGIKSGQNLSALAFLAKIYYGNFADQDKKLSPRERLRAEIGDELTTAAIEGFLASITRSDLPTPIAIAELHAKERYFEWWLAILAGMDEMWTRTERLENFSDILLKTALALATEYSILTYHDDEKNFRQGARRWETQIFIEKPALAQVVLEDMVRIHLRDNGKHSNALYRLVNGEETALWRGKLAMRLFHDFPSSNPTNLRSLLLAAIYDEDCHKELNDLANVITSSNSCHETEQFALWFIVRFLLADTDSNDPFLDYTASREWGIWILKDIIESNRVHPTDKPLELSIKQIESVITAVGRRFPDASFPEGGWTGDHNPWDASQFVQRNITKLSTLSEIAGAEALKRLLANTALTSYHDHVRHALANQAALRREKEYKQPSWRDVAEVLRGGRPASLPDLHALVLDHLETLQATIKQSNTDPYKQFWRCNQYGRVDRPEVEEICRDRLIDLLKPRLCPLGLSVEPEGHMAADKRADIVIILQPGKKLPLELKRDTHSKLWTACENQLKRLYARDPDSAGYGIYGVFWFGDKRSGKVPVAPPGIIMPQNAEALEKSLQSLIPSDSRHRIKAIVIDVTPPGNE